MRRRWPYLAGLLVVGAALVAVLALKGHHHRYDRPPPTTVHTAPAKSGSRRPAGTTPWSASLVSAPSRGPAGAAVAARRFALTYIAFLRHLHGASALANVSDDLRRSLARHRAAAIPAVGATQITGLHVDAPAADGTVGVIVQARVGSSAFGLAITLARRHGRWVAIQIPSAHGSF
jgi:hypothetical protein